MVLYDLFIFFTIFTSLMFSPLFLLDGRVISGDGAHPLGADVHLGTLNTWIYWVLGPRFSTMRYMFFMFWGMRSLDRRTRD